MGNKTEIIASETSEFKKLIAFYNHAILTELSCRFDKLFR